MNLNDSIITIKGIGEKSIDGFSRLNIQTVEDLVHYYPRTYEYYAPVANLKDALEGDLFSVNLTLISNAKLIRYSGKSMITVYGVDSNKDSLEIKFFNTPYLLKTFTKNASFVFRGYIRCVGNRYMMANPKFFKPEDYDLLSDTIRPVYTITKDITNSKIEKSVKTVFDSITVCEDYFTKDECVEYHLMPLEQSIREIHFPSGKDCLRDARRRLVFEEFLSFYHALSSSEKETMKVKNDFPMIEVAECTRFIEKLPFALTDSQREAIKDIFNDMTSPYLMNRLVEGDVGSGKTIVAITALLMCVYNGFQGALMAPTDVLARQHFATIDAFNRMYQLNIKPILLTGKMSVKEKREAKEKIKSGEVNMIIGTHALFQEDVSYHNLMLVITDEQHRFGVNQREMFRDKGQNPHILVMSATPIPRTLAMIVYGNIDITLMKDLPKNRLPILNCIISSKQYKKAYELIEKEVNNKHQAYIICPMIDESESDDFCLKNVTEYSKELQNMFGDKIRVGCLHGKMKQDVKNQIMDDFKDQKYDVLVSTTVVEVGVDVPNATVMMIENSERFGLSQLHQLRGRVGRGESQSYCMLVTDSTNESTLKRLKILNESNDGFYIAQKDMELRGPGELMGVRQSGELQFALGDILMDADILYLVKDIYPKIENRMFQRDNSYIDFRSI